MRWSGRIVGYTTTCAGRGQASQRQSKHHQDRSSGIPGFPADVAGGFNATQRKSLLDPVGIRAA